MEGLPMTAAIAIRWRDKPAGHVEEQAKPLGLAAYWAMVQHVQGSVIYNIYIIYS